jgi:hypothetical protein
MLSHLCGHLWSVGHSCAHHEGGVVHMQLECVHIILIQVVHLRGYIKNISGLILIT